MKVMGIYCIENQKIINICWMEYMHKDIYEFIIPQHLTRDTEP